MGSIPECAGEPAGSLRCTSCTRVYPRVCGGTQLDYASISASEGLSPRVRGNHYDLIHRVLETGSIPACAGEPPIEVRQVHNLGVYPRVCGGTTIAAHRSSSLMGLSPRVRGNHAGVLLGVHGQGSIPACAGEPSHVALREHCRSGLSRVCGGTLTTTKCTMTCWGLSPACAGEPTNDGSKMAKAGVYPRVCGGTANAEGTRT